MLILLLQSAYNIFLDEPAYQEENTIDVIVRTSQAAIFGYFLSANFANRNIKKNNNNTKNNRIKNENINSKNSLKTVENSIGFTTGADNNNDYKLGNIDIENEDEQSSDLDCSKHQIIIVTLICVSCLIILLTFRDFCEVTPRVASKVSQLRDFVSVGVGFLVSCGKNKS